MPCPSSLPDDVQRYQKTGVTHVVSLLTPDEAAFLGLSDEEVLCDKAGITFIQHGIPDFAVPQMDNFTNLVMHLNGHLQNGSRVAVHCRAGIGRSGMVACGVLIARGHGADDAIQHVSAARGQSVPDTPEQTHFLANFARRG